MRYRLPLSRRLKQAATARNRYWSKPEDRLARVNKIRAKCGLPLLECVSQIPQRRGGEA